MLSLFFLRWAAALELRLERLALVSIFGTFGFFRILSCDRGNDSYWSGGEMGIMPVELLLLALPIFSSRGVSDDNLNPKPEEDLALRPEPEEKLLLSSLFTLLNVLNGETEVPVLLARDDTTPSDSFLE